MHKIWVTCTLTPPIVITAGMGKQSKPRTGGHHRVTHAVATTVTTTVATAAATVTCAPRGALPM